MIGGLSNDRIKIINKMKSKETNTADFQLYEKLKDDIFDETEQRLTLWLPLSYEQKVDMILHQRIEEEMEIMVLLLEQELDL